jgi:hypothetical protein
MKMYEYKRKKSSDYRRRHPSYKGHRINGGMLGGGGYRPRRLPIMLHRDYRYNNEQKRIFGQEKQNPKNQDKKKWSSMKWILTSF